MGSFLHQAREPRLRIFFNISVAEGRPFHVRHGSASGSWAKSKPRPRSPTYGSEQRHLWSRSHLAPSNIGAQVWCELITFKVELKKLLFGFGLVGGFPPIAYVPFPPTNANWRQCPRTLPPAAGCQNYALAAGGLILRWCSRATYRLLWIRP